jgi:AcrR family transcriptional regulator
MIVAMADVSKGTFFNYFARKDDLLMAVIDRRMVAAEETAAEVLGLAIPVVDKLLDLFAEAARAWEQDLEWSRHVLTAMGSMTVAPLPRPAAEERWLNLIRRCIEQGQRSGELRRGIDSRRAAALLSAMYHGAIVRWGARPHLDLQDELRAQLELVIRGLAE